MGEDPARQVARAVLYEGYLLWPYRRSALKNQQRWTFGGVYPRPYSEARAGDDPWLMRTEFLLEHVTPESTVDIRVRFLHVVRRDVARPDGAGWQRADELTVAGQRYLSWEETVEREVAATLGLESIVDTPGTLEIDVPAGEDVEWLGEREAALLRSWQRIRGEVEIRATRVDSGLFRLTVSIGNTTPWSDQDRPQALLRTMVSTHIAATAAGARFVSLLDPPAELRAAAEGCTQTGAWPVLIGAPGDRSAMLSSPIILYDYPMVAPESPGDLFDATEIDQLLILNTRTLTDEELREARDTDPRARELVDRCVSLTPEQLMRLHGTMRDIRPVRAEDGGS
jgi:hypothetical protein